MAKLPFLRSPARVTALAILFSCACEETPPATAPTMVAPPPAPAAASPPPEGGVACTFEETKFTWPVPLFVAADLPSYGSAYHPKKLEVTVPNGPSSTGATWRLHGLTYDLEGRAGARELVLHAQSPLIIADVYLPRPHAELHYSRGEPGKLGIAMDLDPRLAVRDPHPVARCVDLSLVEENEFDALAAIDVDGNKVLPRVAVRGTDPVSVATVPGGPEVAVWRATTERYAYVIAEERGFSRVALALGFASVVGWVPAPLLQPTEERWERGTGGGFGYGGSSGGEVVCTTPLSVFVAFEPTDALRAEHPAIDSTPHSIGSLRAGALVQVREADGQFVRVQLASEKLFARDAHFLARSAEIAACTPLNRPRAPSP